MLTLIRHHPWPCIVAVIIAVLIYIWRLIGFACRDAKAEYNAALRDSLGEIEYQRTRKSSMAIWKQMERRENEILEQEIELNETLKRISVQ